MEQTDGRDVVLIIQLLITFVASVLASSGFWIYISQKREKKSLITQLLIGVAHDRIIYLGMTFIRRGYITQEEYINLHDGIYGPYLAVGGDGFASKLMGEVTKLPIKEGVVAIEELQAVPTFLSPIENLKKKGE